jgi:protein subunit release factor A
MADKEKKLLFSLTAKDFEFQTFCTGGNGGQHRNAKQNGVRCIHHPSGARGEHRDGRDQPRNRQEAFRKCAESPQMQAWIRVEAMRRTGQLREIERAVDEAMRPENLLIEEIA